MGWGQVRKVHVIYNACHDLNIGSMRAPLVPSAFDYVSDLTLFDAIFYLDFPVMKRASSCVHGSLNQPYPAIDLTQ